MKSLRRIRMRLLPPNPPPPAPRKYATALSHLPLPSSQQQYTPYAHPLPAFFLPPHPLATTSAITLDHPFFSLFDTHHQSSTSALSYASDDELIGALTSDRLTKERRADARGGAAKEDVDWRSTLDASSAFEALRLRGQGYDLFLQSLSPHLSTVCAHLSRDHISTLASDLLLRNPDPVILRDLLQINAVASSTHRFRARRLRYSLLLTIYSTILPSMQMIGPGALPPLSHRANLLLLDASIAESDASILPQLFHAIYAQAPQTVDGLWPLCQIVLRLTQQGQGDAALGLLSKLIGEGIIPSAARGGRVSPSHPRARELFVYSVVLRTAARWGLFSRARQIAEQVLDTMEQSRVSPPTAALLLEICRTAVAGKKQDEVSWAGGMMLRLAKLEGGSKLPASTLNHYLEELSPRAAATFWQSLPTKTVRPALSPANILRIASTGNITPQAMRDLEGEVYRKTGPGALAGQRADLLASLVDKGLKTIVARLWTFWADRGGVELNASQMIRLIRLVQPSNADLAHRVLQSFLSQQTPTSPAPAIPTLSLADQLRLILGCSITRHAAARPLIASLAEVSPELLQRAIEVVGGESPLDAYELAKLFPPTNASVAPLGIIAEACASGRWEALDGVDVDKVESGPEKRELEVLRLVRDRKFARAEDVLSSTTAEAADVSTAAWRAFADTARKAGKIEYAARAWARAVAQADAGDRQLREVINSGTRLVGSLLHLRSFEEEGAAERGAQARAMVIAGIERLLVRLEGADGEWQAWERGRLEACLDKLGRVNVAGKKRGEVV